MKNKITVFVSGCYDILHAGHIEFFKQARALGDILIVCIPTDEVIYIHKKRRSALPFEHRKRVIEAIKYVDSVVIGADTEPGLNFKTEFLKIKPDILAVTEDDMFEEKKRNLCALTGTKYVKLPKTLDIEPISSTQIRSKITVPSCVPLRVDFAGGWLDVPRLARKGAYIVNCTISPLVSLECWPYEKCSGLGGSGAFALLTGKDSIQSELESNIGWQDPAVIIETGLCVWRSGEKPVLEFKVNPDFLKGRMALYWTGEYHSTTTLANIKRNYALLEEAGKIAKTAAINRDFYQLCEAVKLNYKVQLEEGCMPLPNFGEIAKKYCGSGHGGYGLYLFENVPPKKELTVIEPYMARFFSEF